MVSIEVTNGVKTNLVSPLPILVTFQKTNTDDTAFYVFKDVQISNNQGTTLTPNLPGVWNVNVSINGVGNQPWDYFKYTLAAAPTTGAGGNKVEVTKAVYDAIEESVYYHNLTSGEIVFTHKKGTAGAKYYLYLDRGLFGTVVTDLAANDVLAQMNKIVFVGNDGASSAVYNSGFGIMAAFPMPDPGMAQSFFNLQ